MAYTLTDQDHADIATIEAQLADLDAAIQRHHRTQLTGHDTNPAGDIGGIRSRSAKRKQQIFDRFTREAKTAIKLYNRREALRTSIEWITSGQRAKYHAWNAARAARTAARKARPRRPRVAKPQPTQEQLDAYNAQARAIFDAFEERIRAQRPRRDARDAAGIVSVYAAIQAEIVGQHIRGKRATTADICRGLDDEERRATASLEESHTPPWETYIAARLRTVAEVRAEIAAGAYQL